MELLHRLAASSLTFRDAPLDDALARMRAAGFVRFDLAVIRQYCDHFDPLKVGPDLAECKRVREIVARHDIQAVSLTTYPANPLARDLNGDDWADGVDACVRMGLMLGARHLVFPPGRPAPEPARWRGTVEHARPWLRDAAARTLTADMLPSIALQSNSLLRTAQQGTDFLRILNMRGVGLAVDPAHLAAMGEEPVEAIRRMGSAIGFVALRDTDGANYNLPPGTGTLDYPAILAALDEVGYDGPLILVVDDVSLPPEARADLLKRGWDYLAGMSRRKAA